MVVQYTGVVTMVKYYTPTSLTILLKVKLQIVMVILVMVVQSFGLV